MIAGYGHARVSRPVRHPAADHRRERGARAGRNTWSRPSRSRSRPAASACCATWSRARRSTSTSPGRMHARQCAEAPRLVPCIFEFVYLARPDCVIDGTSVYESRIHMGAELAKRIRAMPEAQDIDVVIPIPDSSRPSALELANRPRAHLPRGLRQEPLHRPHVHHARAGDAQEERAPEAQPDRHGVRGQGRAAGRRLDRARHDVAARSSRWRATPARARSTSRRRARRCAIPNVYGIDMPTQNELVAHGRTRGGDRARDRRRPPDLPGARRAQARGARGQSAPDEFEASCFDGHYVTGDVTPEYLAQLAGDASRGTRRAGTRRRSRQGPSA